MRARCGVFFLVSFLISVAALLPAQEAEWYQGKPIQDIVFVGLQRVDREELEGIVSPYLRKPFTDDVYWEILGKLYALEYFETISPTATRGDALGEEVIIRFEVQERPVVGAITFKGNSGIRRADLLAVVTLKVDDVATPLKLRVDEIAIRNKYLEKGYPGVQVSSEMTQNSKGTMDVVFTIDEGDKVVLGEIRFEGNNAFSAKTLQRQLTLKVKGVFNDGAFQEASLIADRETVAQYYRDRGYVDAQVTDVVRETMTDDKGREFLALTFKIYEGRAYTFGGVTFEGNHIFPTEQLQGLVLSKTGEVVNDQKIQADLLRVADLYYENGYIFNLIEPVAVRDETAGTLSYVMTIVERGRAHIENIIIKGNEKTKDEVILREIPLETGDVFSKTKVMEGLRNLYNLQFFGQAIYPETPYGSADNLMDLVITVEEQPWIEVQGGITYSGSADPDVFPISATASVNNRNIFGSGNQLGFETTLSYDTQSATVSYTQNWVVGFPLSVGFDLSFEHSSLTTAMDNQAPWFYGDETYAYPDGFNSYDEYVDASYSVPSEYQMPYEQWALSLGVSTGYRWSTPLGNFTLSGGVRVGETLNAYDTGVYRPFDPVLRAENARWTPATSFWTSASLDQRDIYYDPSTGYYGIQRMGWYGLFDIEQEHYFRTDTKVEGFLTLLDLPVSEDWSFKMVLGAHSGLSFIFPQSGSRELTIESASKLAVDGMFTGRGWSGEYRNKGLALWENWVELRIPIAPGILAWDFFFDAAEVADKPWNVFSTDENGSFAERMRFSLGGGLRIAIPQFPFRLSLGKRFKIVDGQVEWIGGNTGGNLDVILSFSLSRY